MFKHQIEVNDIVAVNFHNAQYTLTENAKVLHIPVATGDSWGILDLDNGMVHNISEGCTISLMEKNNVC